MTGCKKPRINTATAIKLTLTVYIVFASLAAGNIVGAMDEAPVISYAINQGQDLAINLPSCLTSWEVMVLLLMKGENSKLIDGFNKALTQMKAKANTTKSFKNTLVVRKQLLKKMFTLLPLDNSFAHLNSKIQIKNSQY